MKASKTFLTLLAVLAGMMGLPIYSLAQIPTLEVCRATVVTVQKAFIDESDAAVKKRWVIDLDAYCAPGRDPILRGLSIKEEVLQGSLWSSSFTINAQTLDQLTSVGHMAFMSGRCNAGASSEYCQYWLTVAQNKVDPTTPGNVIAFAIVQKEKMRVAGGKTIAGTVKVMGSLEIATNLSPALDIPTVNWCPSTTGVAIQSDISPFGAAFSVPIETQKSAYKSGVVGLRIAAQCQQDMAPVLSHLELDTSNLAGARSPNIKGKTLETLFRLSDVGGNSRHLVFMKGRCERDGVACRVWVFVLENGSPHHSDLVGFVALQNTGQLLAYGIAATKPGWVSIVASE